MNENILPLLNVWYEYRDTSQWVLGIIYETSGSSYRKPGAVMLLGSEGQRLGMLSGGCLESDIHQNARRVMASGLPQLLTYDSQDEDDMAFQLGIGCGGCVRLALLPVNKKNDYLDLVLVRQCLGARESVYYKIPIFEGEEAARACIYTTQKEKNSGDIVEHQKDIIRCVDAAKTNSFLCVQRDTPRHSGDENDKKHVPTLYILWHPPISLLVCGGGADAVPFVNMAKSLGWYVAIADVRPANARREHFYAADEWIHCEMVEYLECPKATLFDALMIMHHSISLDAQIIKTIFERPLALKGLRYIGMLGPSQRKSQVISVAKLSEMCQQRAHQFIDGPAGFDIGGQLSESIALSILSKCHQTLFKASADNVSMSSFFRSNCD